MMEYRWDEGNDRYYFVELNGRFWGSLHLALFAKVDFPTLLVDAFFGHRPNRFPKPVSGVKCRHTVPGELQYVWSRIKSRNLPLRSKLWSALEFVFLSFSPTVHSDLLFPGDRQLYWQGIQQYGREVCRALKRRLGF